MELQVPLAVAQHLLEAPTKKLEPSSAPEEGMEEEGGLEAGDKEDPAEKVSTHDNHSPSIPCDGDRDDTPYPDTTCRVWYIGGVLSVI